MSVIQALEGLPGDGLTVTALQALDSLIPGEWSPTHRFDELTAAAVGSDKPAVLAEVRRRAEALQGADPRFERALAAYSAVDRVDQVAAATAAANKVGALFGGKLGFLQQFTPKPETTQALDAGAKLVAELLAFGLLNGLPTDRDGLQRFVVALADYAAYDRVRIGAWVVYDGLLPLGPDFVSILARTFTDLADSALVDHAGFSALSGRIPGDTPAAKKAFVVQTIDATGDWVQSFVTDNGLTREAVMGSLRGTLSLAEGSLDVVAAAIDASTSVYSHTGTQTVARALARRAADDLRDDVWKQYLDGL